MTAKAMWERLAQKRVCFGHQSVGADLMNGLSALDGCCLDIVQSHDPEIFRRPVFAHFQVGENRDPQSKCRAFAQVIDNGVGAQVDIALFKFCYVDITATTDVDELFQTYRGIMNHLSHRYPKVAFFHVTVPLRQVGDGWLGWLREKSGRFDPERDNQIRRHLFNQKLRSAYGTSGRLFDLAKEEATYPDGRSSCFRHHGEAVPNLVSDYTDDGGHLNRHAAKEIAGRLLTCLSTVD